MTAAFTFTVSSETLEQVKANRLKFFEQQIAESQVNIRIYEANVASFGLPADTTALNSELAKLDRLVLNYNTVNNLST